MQEPGGTGEEILNGVRYVRPGGGFEPAFPLVQKLEVNGDKQHPFFALIKSRCPSPVTQFRQRERLFYSPQDSNDIRWNFEKFLIDREGTPVRRYEPVFKPSDMTRDIDTLTRWGTLPPLQE